MSRFSFFDNYKLELSIKLTAKIIHGKHDRLSNRSPVEEGEILTARMVEDDVAEWSKAID